MRCCWLVYKMDDVWTCVHLASEATPPRRYRVSPHASETCCTVQWRLGLMLPAGFEQQSLPCAFDYSYVQYSTSSVHDCAGWWFGGCSASFKDLCSRGSRGSTVRLTGCMVGRCLAQHRAPCPSRTKGLAGESPRDLLLGVCRGRAIQHLRGVRVLRVDRERRDGVGAGQRWSSGRRRWGAGWRWGASGQRRSLRHQHRSRHLDRPARARARRGSRRGPRGIVGPGGRGRARRVGRPRQRPRPRAPDVVCRPVRHVQPVQAAVLWLAREPLLVLGPPAVPAVDVPVLVALGAFRGEGVLRLQQVGLGEAAVARVQVQAAVGVGDGLGARRARARRRGGRG
jgi:hypothetical protein